MDIQDWCEQCGLSRDTAFKLRFEGFATVEDMSNVTDDDVRVTFQRLQKLPLQQCVILREALGDFKLGNARRRPKEGISIADWSLKHNLDSETRKELEKEGFVTADDINYVTSSDVRTTFQEKGRLPLKQCIALRKAVEGKGAISLQQSVDQNGVTTAQTSEWKVSAGKTTTTHTTAHVRKNIRPCVPPPSRTTQVKRVASERHSFVPEEERVDERGHDSSISVSPTIDNSQRLGRKAKSRGAKSDRKGSKDVEYILVVAGGEGSGKSHTVQTIAGLQSHRGAEADRGGIYRGHFHGHSVQVLDTSGWFTSGRHPDEAAAMMARDLQQLHPGPDAVLYTIDVSSRFTKEDSVCYSLLDAIFRRQLHKSVVLLFTHGDILRDQGRELEDMLHNTAPQDLNELLEKCNDRYLLWDNLHPEHNDPDKLLGILEDVKTRHLSASSPRRHKQRLLPESHAEAAKQVAERLDEAQEDLLKSSTLVQAREQQQQKAAQKIKRSSKVLEKRARQHDSECSELQDRVRELETAVEDKGKKIDQ